MKHSFLTQPFCHPEDAGKTIPDSEHAISVCLPTWQDIVDYREKNKQIPRKLRMNYPRFSFHSLVQKLNTKYKTLFAKPGEDSVVFPSESVATRAQAFLIAKTGKKESVRTVEHNGVFALCFPKEYMETVLQYWRYSGEIVSSRRAEALLRDKVPEKKSNEGAKRKIQERIAEFTGELRQNVALFPTGMAAFFTIHRFLQISFPERKSVQIGFAYSDALKVQEAFGNGVHFFANGNAEDFRNLEELLVKEKVLGIFCELPVNPGLPTLDLSRLQILAKKYTVPIVIDDTMGTFQNREAFAFADIVVSSLTKFFSGAGNVMGGALILHPESRFGDMFRRVFRVNFEDLLWEEDTVVLEENSRDFVERMKHVQATAQKLVEFLTTHESVYKVFLPELEVRGEQVRSFKGMFSFLLYKPEQNTSRFYDALSVNKGIGFGMNWTMVCPYTQLQWEEQEDIMKKCGLSPYLLRVSVGLEDADDLIGRFEKALAL